MSNKPRRRADAGTAAIRSRVLRSARSDDGLEFIPDSKPLVRSAGEPTLTRLEDGRLLLVFESYRRARRGVRRELVYATSAHQGKSWTEPKPLRIKGLKKRHGPPRGPVLIPQDDGLLTLYFACEEDDGRQRIYLAGSKRGPRFGLKGPVSFHAEPPRWEALLLFDVGGVLHVIASPVETKNPRFHGTVSDDVTIRSEGALSADIVGNPGSVLQAGGTFRLYAGTAEGVVSATSADGYGWTREPGLRLARAADPAVVRLEDGSFLMVYRERLVRDIGREDGRGDDAGRTARRDEQNDSDALAQGEAGGEDTWGEADAPPESSQPPDTAQVLDELSGDPSTDPMADESTEVSAEDASEFMSEMLEDAGGEFPESEDDVQLYCEGNVPIPDFKHPVNYRQWMENRYDADAPVVNAFDYYDDFMPHPHDAPGEKPEWPEMISLYNQVDGPSVTSPWKPDEHPEWETTASAAADLLDRYAEAAAIEDYVPRITYSSESQEDAIYDEDGRNLLMNILLPSLSGHRTLTKQVLSDAWRAPDGKPDPQTMLDAFETTLGSAEHLSHGDFLIETLVSIASRNLIEENARRALQHDVFSAEEMEAALEIFVEKDRPLPDPGEWVVGELAAGLDSTQYLYGPVGPDREPRLNPERVNLLSSGFGADGGGLPSPTPEQIADSDPQESTQRLIDYYREFADMARQGYPGVKVEDFKRLEEKYTEGDYVAQLFLPSLARVHALVNRQEASRRATQVTYAIHLHKARTGRWPASLDELPQGYVSAARIDPFTKQDFGYRLTEEGPLLYSRSENGVDDGAVHHSRWGDRQDDGLSDDYVFWPPQPRP